MASRQEAHVVALRQRHGRGGARRLKERYALAPSDMAIHRVIRQHPELLKTRRKRYRKRRDLSVLKKTLRPFAQGQVDTKDLSDILQYWPLMTRLR